MIPNNRRENKEKLIKEIKSTNKIDERQIINNYKNNIGKNDIFLPKNQKNNYNKNYNQNQIPERDIGLELNNKNNNNNFKDKKNNDRNDEKIPQLEPIPKHNFDFGKFNGDYLPDDILDFGSSNNRGSNQISIEQQLINEAIQRSLVQK